jgi:hypothetical protein
MRENILDLLSVWKAGTLDSFGKAVDKIDQIRREVKEVHARAFADFVEQYEAHAVVVNSITGGTKDYDVWTREVTESGQRFSALVDGWEESFFLKNIAKPIADYTINVIPGRFQTLWNLVDNRPPTADELQAAMEEFTNESLRYIAFTGTVSQDSDRETDFATGSLLKIALAYTVSSNPNLEL